MRTYIIHPLKQLIIRPDVMFEDELSLDRLNDDLSYKWEKARTSDTQDPIEFLNSVKGKKGKSGRMRVPKHGWVKVQVSNDVDIEEIWKVAMSKVGNKDFVL